jgi:hypothetical protein
MSSVVLSVNTMEVILIGVATTLTGVINITSGTVQQEYATITRKVNSR